MKKYVVKTIKDFNDYGGKEVNGKNKYIERKKGDIYSCSKERYLFLKEHEVVILMGILK